MFLCLARAFIYYRGSTLSFCYLAPSFSYSWSLFKVVPEFCVYQDSTESLIITFSVLPILLEKLVNCYFLDWKQSKFAWYHMQISYLREWLALFRVPSFCGTMSGPLGRVPDAPPNSKVIAVTFVWIIPNQESHMFLCILVSWEFLRGCLSHRG